MIPFILHPVTPPRNEPIGVDAHPCDDALPGDVWYGGRYARPEKGSATMEANRIARLINI